MTACNPVHDTITKSYRHMNFFQHECVLQVRTPRVKLPSALANSVMHHTAEASSARVRPYQRATAAL